VSDDAPSLRRSLARRLHSLLAWRPRGVVILIWIMALVGSAPAWIVRHPPLQDLPLHLAVLRVVHDYGDPQLALTQTFELGLTQTAYVLYYLAGTLLAYVFGVWGANAVLMSCYLAGTPLALRELLVALDKDERLALFAIPLVVNKMFTIGLLPFVLALPLMLLTMARVIEYVRNPTRKAAVWASVLVVLLFFCHVLPFAIFGVVYILVFPWLHPRRWLRAAIPGIPGLLCILWWANLTAAGSTTASHLDAETARPLAVSFQRFLDLTTNVFHDGSDEYFVTLVAFIALIAWCLTLGEPETPRPIIKRYGLIVPACLFLYLSLGSRVGDVFLLSERFPVPMLLCAIPLLRLPHKLPGLIATAALVIAGCGSVANVCGHFLAFERNEVGGIDRAIGAMTPGKKVIGLIFNPSNQTTTNFPFLHYVSYYQAAKGGVAMFTFAHFPHWPFHFREGHFPPPGAAPRLNWEWEPDRVTFQEIHPYYDYVLVRGRPIELPASTHHLHYQDAHWAVWAKHTPAR